MILTSDLVRLIGASWIMYRMVTYRARLFHLGDAVHGHVVEYLYEAFCLVLAVWQLAVCPGFYTGEQVSG